MRPNAPRGELHGTLETRMEGEMRSIRVMIALGRVEQARIAIDPMAARDLGLPARGRWPTRRTAHGSSSKARRMTVKPCFLNCSIFRTELVSGQSQQDFLLSFVTLCSGHQPASAVIWAATQ